MANPEHVERLKQGYKIWNKWRKENKYVIPDLSEANLLGAGLVWVDLRQVDLREAILSRADLREAKLNGANLAGANLSGADLSRRDLHETTLKGANLWGTNLRNTNLSNVDLSQTNLTEAKLIEANLTGTNLSGSNLVEADLTKANMQGANLNKGYAPSINLRGASLVRASFKETNLIRANFDGADLRETDFQQALFGYSSFSDLDLSVANNLDSANHSAPSSIGIDTFYLSKGNIPNAFLRGCGVPDKMINFANTSVRKAVDYYDFFISYSHADKVFAQRIYERLYSTGIRCWLDEHEMIVGQKVDRQIEKGLRSSERTLLICSENSLKSWWVDGEIATSFELERNMQKDNPDAFRLMPLDIDGFIHSPLCNAETTVTGGKLSQIRQRYIGQFKGWEHDSNILEREIEKVIRAIKSSN